MSPAFLPHLALSSLLDPDPDADLSAIECQVAVTVEYGVVHARVCGDVDYIVTPSLRRDLIAYLTGDVYALVVDLTEVTMLSVSAMETLLIVEEMAHEFGVAMYLVADSRAVLRPLILTGLHRRLRIHPSLDEVMSVA